MLIRVTVAVVGVCIIAIIVGAVVFGSPTHHAANTSKADSDACYAQEIAHVNAAPFQPTRGEEQTFYNYCMDLRQGRVPTARPDF